MKLPEKIKGYNRIRDGAIVLFFKRDHLDYIELAEKFKLTERRIQQILAKNHAFVKRDKEWEKEKRINRLQRWLKKEDGKLRESAKDPVDIQAEIRKEIEGNDVNVNLNKTEKIVIIRYDEHQDEKVAGRVRVLQEAVSGDVVELGNGKEHESDIAGHALQRADT